MNQFQKLFLTAKLRLRLLVGVPCRNNSELSYRLNRLPLDTKPGATFPFPWGNLAYVSASDLRGQFTEIFEQRQYAFKTAATAPVIIDAGGNIGVSAIWFKQAYPNAKLTVYEADPALAALLAQNLAAAGVTDVDVQNAAVWDKDGTVSFDNRGHDKGMVSTNGTVQVRAVDLALHLPERVDLLKLDVEGAEYAIIQRLTETGTIARVQNLVAEFHIKRGDMDACLVALRRLREAGMQVAFKAEIGSWLGDADPSPFEAVAGNHVLAEVFAWR
jgi:FkbM family methyltransferase